VGNGWADISAQTQQPNRASSDESYFLGEIARQIAILYMLLLLDEVRMVCTNI